MPHPKGQTILFLCTGNSCRSQMAEGFGRSLAREGVTVLSAGTDPKGIHPRAQEAMEEVGLDIRGQASEDLSAFDLTAVDLVVTLCGSADERCPVLPPWVAKEHWPVPDPAEALGSEEEVKAAFRAVRDDIRERVEKLFSRLDP